LIRSCGLGYVSWYSDSLRSGGSGDPIPVGRDFPHPSKPALGPTQPPVQWIPGLLPGGKVAGTWRWLSAPCTRLKKEKKYTFTPLQWSFVASYGGETWSPTLTEEYMLKVSKTGLLRKIFEPKRKVTVSKWRIFYKEELRQLLDKHYSGDQIKKNEMN